MRSLSFYTLVATLPLTVVAAILLFTRIDGTALVSLSVLGALTYILGFGRLLYETMSDITGFPIWSVFYLIAYLIGGFMFLFFALHVSAPGQFFSEFGPSNKDALLDALYLSVVGYVGQPPEIQAPSRFLTVGQGVLSMLLNIVIITKFVHAF